MKYLKRFVTRVRQWEFGKKLLVSDYAIFVGIFVCQIIYRNEIDLTTVLCAYIGQLAIATGFYYWKAKCENRIKIPISVLKTLPKELREPMDLTTIITAIIQAE